MTYRTRAELDRGLARIQDAPRDRGTLELIVRRPAVDEREVLEEAEIDLAVGLVGDTWSERPSTSSADGGPHPDKQLTLMNARCVALLAGERDHWPAAGDQLYVDFDLSHTNVPAGTRLAIGDAVVEITEPPHRGCAKFSQRFGLDALRFVNSEIGSELRLRGANARVVTPGAIRRGDPVQKV